MCKNKLAIKNGQYEKVGSKHRLAKEKSGKSLSGEKISHQVFLLVLFYILPKNLEEINFDSFKSIIISMFLPDLVALEVKCHCLCLTFR